MKKLVLFLMFVVPMMVFAQGSPNVQTDNQFTQIVSPNVQMDNQFVQVIQPNVQIDVLESFAETQFNVEYETIDGVEIKILKVENYQYDCTKGTLMLMYTENRLFGLKFYNDKGLKRYWFNYGNKVLEIPKDLWTDIR